MRPSGKEHYANSRTLCFCFNTLIKPLIKIISLFKQQSLRFEKGHENPHKYRMPCACQVPIPQYPETAEWGPIFWNIIHGLAEKAEKSIIREDEVREWQKFVKAIGEVLPCDICRDHYKRYTAQNPFTQIAKIPFNQVKDFVKHWFWNLHNEINLGNDKPVFDYSLLAETYSAINLDDQYYRLLPVMKKAITLNGVPFMKWQAWVSSYRMMRAILCL